MRRLFKSVTALNGILYIQGVKGTLTMQSMLGFTAMNKSLPNQKQLFDIPDEVLYFNFSYMSPLLRSVHQVGMDSVGGKCHPWKIHPSDFFKETDKARDLFSKIVHSAAGDIAIIPSASYGVATAALNLDLKAGDEVLLQAEEFPSLYYALQRKAKESGAKIVQVPRPLDGNWTKAVSERISKKTKAVGIGPVHWTDGSLIDCVEIGRLCRKFSAMFIVDACQSVGVMPFDVREVQPDFLIVPTYKWMLGPYSLAFMYVSPKFQTGRPIEEAWSSRAGCENFANLTQYCEDYQKGALRFDMGERGNPIGLPMATKAMSQILDWGVENISNSLRPLTDQIVEGARALGFKSIEKEFRCAHMIGLRHPRKWDEQNREHLASKGIYLSLRGEYARISPHLNISESDCDQLISALRELI